MTDQEKDLKETVPVPDGLSSAFTRFILTFYFRIQEHPVTLTNMKLNSHSYHILYILDSSPEKQVPMTQLVTRIHRTRQQLSKLISDLEDAGLVERSRTCENRRQVYVSLTQEGKTLTAEIFACMTHAIEENLKQLPKEKLSVIRNITENLQELFKQLEEGCDREDFL